MKQLLYILFLLISTTTYAQSKADRLFEGGFYADAIPSYKRIIKKDSSNTSAIENIAYCYKKLNDYENAERYYLLACQRNPTKAENFLNYGQVLKQRGKLAQAKGAFETYLKSNPSSLIGKLMLQSCGDIESWKIDPDRFIVKPLKDLNFSGAEFNPIPYKNGLIFITDRAIDHVTESEAGWNHTPYLSVFFAPFKDGDSLAFDKAKRFDNVFNSDYHDGPLVISNDGSKAYFTRVEHLSSKNETINQMKLLEVTLTNKGADKNTLKELPFNTSDYSVGHPAISDDGSILVFASNKANGVGKMDLYESRFINHDWTTPKLLDSTINTPGNEVFPYFHDDYLYFSSDGHPGYGGLDLYRVNYKNREKLENLRAPLNSNADDFSVSYKNNLTGYFSSNRLGGTGGDDIYFFRELPYTEDTLELTGIFEYNSLPIEGANLELVDAGTGEVISTIATGPNGTFRFQKLSGDKNYLIRLNEDETNEELYNYGELYLTNKAGAKVMLIERVKSGEFSFKPLHADDLALMPILEEENENDNLLTITVFGQVYHKLPGDYSAGLKVHLVNDEGVIIATVYTDSLGKFHFEKLSPDEKYLFQLGEDDEVHLIITDENGKILEVAHKQANKTFMYKRLSGDENMISLLNEEDEIIKIKEDENFVISNIYYDYNSWEINPRAAKELDKLVLILEKNSHIGIELESHTDSRASDTYNLNLSKKRAEVAVKYIVEKGIDTNRLTPVGYGETRLVNSCDNNTECSEEEHAKNRRTEFKIIRK